MYAYIYIEEVGKFNPFKSQCLFIVSNGEPDDSDFWQKRLYENESGGFFLVSLTSLVGERCWEGYEDIVPLTEEEAKEWVREWYYDDVSSASYQDSGALKRFIDDPKDSKGSCRE